MISAAQLAGGEKGRPVYDIEALADAHGGHWVVLTGCRKGAVPAALAHGGPEAAWRELAVLAGMFGHENVMVELTCQHDPGDDERNDMLARLAALADLGVVATGNVHFAAPAQARLGQALAAIRARRSLADMDGWLPAAGTAYLRSGEEMEARLAQVPGRPRAHRRTGPPVRVRLQGDRSPATRLPGPARPHRGLLAARTGRAQGPGPLRVSRGRTGARRARPDRQGARGNRAPRVRRLLPDRARHRGVLRGQRHLVPGPRVGGELGGLLRARHHQRRPGLAPPAVRAVPVRGPGRPARHRPGHRAPPPRGSNSVRLPHLRAGPGRPGGQRDLVPAADGAAGRGPRARVRADEADAWAREIGPGPAADGEALPVRLPPP